MRRQKYPPVAKARREYFGGVIFRERPAFLAHVNKAYADAYGIPETKGAVLCDGVFSAPLDAHLALTTGCNLFCKGCYNTREGDEQKDIPLDMAKAIIRKLSELGVFSLSFGGGEPSLHPNLFEIAAYAREKQVLPNMTTNGLTMTKEFARQCGVFGNVHFSVRRWQDMNHIIPAIRTYRNGAGNKPGLNLLLTAETYPHLDQIIDMAARSGVRRILLLRYKTTAKNAGISGLCVDHELKDLPLRLRKLQKPGRHVMFLFDCSLFEILAGQGLLDADRFRRFDTNGCQGGNAYIAIDVNGMYKPCSFWQEPFGSVLDLGFDNWIHDPALTGFRNRRRDDACALCEFETLCNGGCRLLSNKDCI